MLLAGMLVAVPTARAADTYDLSGAQKGWVDKDATSLMIGGKPYTSGMNVNYGDTVKFELHWSVPNNSEGVSGGIK